MGNRSYHEDRHHARHTHVGDKPQAVCVDVGRVFDSCSDRDCVEELPVYFSQTDQAVIEQATAVRAVGAEILGICIDVDALPLQEGCYSCKLTFFAKVKLEAFSGCGCECTTVCGCVTFEKQVVLYGGEGTAQVFDSEFYPGCHNHCEMNGGNMPRCQVQVAQPVVLEARLGEACDCCCSQTSIRQMMPQKWLSSFGGSVCDNDGNKRVTVTLGVFTIIQLVRNAQMLIPVYDYCLPCKECNNDELTPCDVFKRMSFPMDEFFPPMGKCPKGR